MDHKVGALCKLIEALHRQFSHWVREVASERQRELHEKVIRTYAPLEDGRLGNMLARAKKGEAVDFSTAGRFLFLEAPESELAVLPILSLKLDLVKPELRARMGLFTLDGSRLAAIGFRFETPEGVGRHNYHHAQLIRSLGAGSDLPFPSWLPESQPALVLSAKNPYSLLLGLLIALYGLGHLEGRMKGQSFLQHLAEDLEELKNGSGSGPSRP
jgi:hypothetical protein